MTFSLKLTTREYRAVVSVAFCTNLFKGHLDLQSAETPSKRVPDVHMVIPPLLSSQSLACYVARVTTPVQRAKTVRRGGQMLYCVLINVNMFLPSNFGL